MTNESIESMAIEKCPNQLHLPTYVQGFVDGANWANTELAKENAELKAEIQNLEGIKLAQETALNTEYIIEDSYKRENAELKEKLGNVQMQKAGEKSDLVWKLKTANEQKTEQLTQAKEIIEELYNIILASMSDYAKEPMEHAKKFMTENK